MSVEISDIDDSPKYDSLMETLVSHVEKNARGGPANVVDGLFAIARSLELVAYQIKFLGNGDASTTMGAIEALSVQVKEGLDEVAVSVGGGLQEIAREVGYTATDNDPSRTDD